MTKIRDLTGQTFGHLTALEMVPIKKHQNGRIWLCRCACGTELEVPSANLVRGAKKTCGCGLASDGRLGRSKNRQSQTPEYRAWVHMMKISDLDPVNRGRPEHWSNFHLFMKDMGPRPEKYRIATRDLNKPYSKENNYWKPPKEVTENEKIKREQAAEEFKRTFAGSEDLVRLPESPPGK